MTTAHPAPDMGDLIARAYDELHGLASTLMRGEREGHSFHTTVLLHETCLRLLGLDGFRGAHHGSFFALAARAMRRVLIDHARTQSTQKRGGDAVRVPFDLVERDLADVVAYPKLDMIGLEQALERLARSRPRHAEIVELRVFAGLTPPQIAEELGVCRSTVDKSWAIARLELIRLMGG